MVEASMSLRLTFAVAIASTSCTNEEPASPPSSAALVGKCLFADGAATSITPGEIFLYVFHDADDRYGVTTGAAIAIDPLLERRTVQGAEPYLPARLVPPNRLEFGNFDRAGDGPADHFLSVGDRNGEIATSIGTTYDTDRAYPRCVFWAHP